jgi:hypothetical protein
MNAGETACGFIIASKGGDTFREEQAPKGESQERRWCEIKPARNLREETVKRVTKP